MRWPPGPLCCSTLSQEMRSRCPKHPKREGWEAEPAGLCVADSGDRALGAESRHLPIPPRRRTPHPSQSHRDGWRTRFICDFQDGVQSRKLPLPPPPKSTNNDTHNNKNQGSTRVQSHLSGAPGGSLARRPPFPCSYRLLE